LYDKQHESEEQPKKDKEERCARCGSPPVVLFVCWKTAWLIPESDAALSLSAGGGFCG